MIMQTLSARILDFLFSLQLPIEMPEAVEVLYPFAGAETKRVMKEFYNKYYYDNHPRYGIIGINPGRFGGGVTGIPFTDPIRLEKECGIENSWPRKQELSSVFIYDMINAFGGPDAFYRKLYFTSVSPLGFTKAGKNLNYYDDKILAQNIIPFAVDCLREQIRWGLHTSIAFCLGEGANYKFLSRLNLQYKLFDNIVPLSHPRFIMQYKLKTKDNYIDKYLREFMSLE